MLKNTEDIPGPSKKPRRDCKYQNEWRSHGMLPSRKGPTFALCESCGMDINIGHVGLNDVRKHLATSKHQEVRKATSSTMALKAFFRPSPLDESITRAEVLFANFIAEHNLPFMLSDHFTHHVSAMFLIAKLPKDFGVQPLKQLALSKVH